MTFKEREDLRDPKVKKTIVELRNKGTSWKTLVKELEEKTGVRCSIPTAKVLFEKEIAKTITTSPKSKDQFRANISMLHERWQRAQKLLDKLEDAFNKAFEKYKDSPDLWIIKFGPTLLALTREMVNQLEFVRKEQERITIQQKNLIWSPIQINMQIHKFIKEYEKEGYIKILKNIPIEPETEDEEEDDISESKKQEKSK